MAVYYVDQVGGLDTNDGTLLSWKTVAKVNGVALAAGDKVFFKGGCSWAEQLSPATSGSNGNPITFGSYGGGSPNMIGGGWALTTNSKSYLTFEGLTFPSKLVYAPSSTGVVFNRCNIHTSVSNGLHSSGSTVTMNYCTVSNVVGNGVYAVAASTVVMNNCVVTGCTTNGVRAEGISHVTIRNSIITGNGVSGYGLSTIDTSTIDYDYNVIAGNRSFAPAANVSLVAGSTDGGHNKINVDPKIRKYPTVGGIFCLNTDDWDIAYSQSVANVLPANVKMTAFVNPGNVSAGGITAMRQMADSGHEIAIHGWNHSILDATTGFTVTTTNASPTINIDLAGQQIILTTTTGSNGVAIGMSIGQTILSLKTAVAGKGWTITNSSNVADGVRLDSLSSSGGAKSAFPYTAALDISAPNYKYYDNEIAACIPWITTNAGVAPTTISYPWGNFSDNLITYLNGVLGLRGGRGVGTGTGYTQSSINIFKVRCVQVTDWLGDGSEATIRACARHYYVFNQGSACINIILAHSAAEFTPQQWGWYVSEIISCGGQFTTFKDASERIRASSTTSDGLTFARTVSDAANYRLQPGSPCRNAGIDVELTADISGRAITGLPDIGAYEFQPAAKSGFGFGLKLGFGF